MQYGYIHAQKKITLETLPYYLRDSIIRHDTLSICELGLYLMKFKIQDSKIVNVHFSEGTLSLIKTTITNGIDNINKSSSIEYNKEYENRLYIIPIFINMETCGRKGFEYLLEGKDTLQAMNGNPRRDSILAKLRGYKKKHPVSERLFESSANLLEFDDGTVLSNKDCRVLDKILLQAIY